MCPVTSNLTTLIECRALGDEACVTRRRVTAIVGGLGVGPSVSAIQEDREGAVPLASPQSPNDADYERDNHGGQERRVPPT